MLRTGTTESHRLIGAVAVIDVLQIRDYGDGGSIQEGQTPTSASLDGRLQAFLATEIKSAERSCTRQIIIAGQSIVAVDNFTVCITDCGGQHRMPHFCGNQTFQGLREPSEVRMCVGNTKHRTLHRDTSAFGNCHNFNGQVAQLVQVCDFLHTVHTLAKGCVHYPLVVGHYLVKRLAEELIIEVINEVCLNEALQLEHNHLIPTLHSAHTRSEIGDRLGNSLGQHFCVDSLVEVNQKHRIHFNHISITSIFSCFLVSRLLVVKTFSINPLVKTSPSKMVFSQ